MRLTRRTAEVYLGEQAFTVSELTCAEAEAIQDIVLDAEKRNARPLLVTAQSLAVALKAKHPDITAEQILGQCTQRELMEAMRTVNEISSLGSDAKGEAGSP